MPGPSHSLALRLSVGDDSERDRLAGTLGVSADVSLEDLNTRFKQLAKVHHPDHGGDSHFMSVLAEAHGQLVRMIHDDEAEERLLNSGSSDGWQYAGAAALGPEPRGSLHALGALILPMMALALAGATIWFMLQLR